MYIFTTHVLLVHFNIMLIKFNINAFSNSTTSDSAGCPVSEPVPNTPNALQSATLDEKMDAYIMVILIISCQQPEAVVGK